MSAARSQVIFPTGKLGRVPYPRTLAVAPLFSLAQRGREKNLVAMEEVEVEIGVASNVRVQRWGVGLTAEHQDVLLAIFRKFAGLEATLDAAANREQRAYIEVQFSAKELLTILSKSYNEQNRDWLRRRLKDLSRSHLTVQAADANPNSWPLFSGCILQLRAREKPTQGVRCSVSIPIEFVQLFTHLGYGQIDLEQRSKLGSSQLAKLLQAQIECLKDRKSNTHHPYSVAKWMELTGTKSSEANFGGELRKALKRLKEAGFLADYRVSRGKVYLELPTATGAKPPALELREPSQARRLSSVTPDDKPLRLGEEVPAIEELLGAGKWSPPLGIEVYADRQLQAMLHLYPKAYAKRPELPSMLERVRAELDVRAAARPRPHRQSPVSAPT